MKTTVRYQNKTQWLKGRESRKNPRITATDVAKIAGSNPYESRAQLMNRKLGLVPSDDLSDNDLVQFGFDMEEAVARKTAVKLQPKYELVYPGKWDVQIHPREVWAAATCDFFLANTNNRTITMPLEIKTGDHNKWIHPPPYYVDQLIWQMYVTGAECGCLSVLLLPEYEERRKIEVMEKGRARVVSASLRYEYLSTVASRDMERILRSIDDATVAPFFYSGYTMLHYCDKEVNKRKDELLEKAKEFYGELKQRFKEEEELSK